MLRRILVFSNVAVLAALLAPAAALAQQGQQLYEWSGGWGRTSGASSYPYSAPNSSSTPIYAAAPGNERVTDYEPFYPTSVANRGGNASTSAAGAGARSNRGVLINISVPADAEIWFDRARTTQKGEFRQFVSPPLTPGRDYFYDIKARWTENGKEVTQN